MENAGSLSGYDTMWLKHKWGHLLYFEVTDRNSDLNFRSPSAMQWMAHSHCEMEAEK